ncbi:cephalosporin hydroxylase [Candidatus Nitrosotenuis cloacae]|uniref:Cephalosporin hydroxylase n=2 Tax=Candidatus Nitrosotenuis cloacae TaxID=1603555 RepID=A0A3G1B3I3_9ARCH|nr:cephalosporin hydroxylase [Candidatus Nitrosotenuis cloacae]
MNDRNFELRNQRKIKIMALDKKVKATSKKWFSQTYKHEYSYHFRWLGRPIIQYPQDIVALQEIVWNIKPDLIIETGIARGGSLIFFASLLELIGKGSVLGIDVDIRSHNRKEIEKHPLSKRINMIEGSSIDEKTVKDVYSAARGKKNIMVVLDSNHTHDHVLKELEFYSPIVTKNSYLVVFDTVVADLPQRYFANRPWKKFNNPKSALIEFLKNNRQFRIDSEITNKLAITAAPDGYLKRIK